MSTFSKRFSFKELGNSKLARLVLIESKVKVCTQVVSCAFNVSFDIKQQINSKKIKAGLSIVFFFKNT